MFEFSIDKVCNVLINQAKLFNCSLEFAWDNCMHSYITEQFTLTDVLNYIEDMEILKVVEERVKTDNGVRYSLDDIKEIANTRLRSE